MRNEQKARKEQKAQKVPTEVSIISQPPPPKSLKSAEHKCSCGKTIEPLLLPGVSRAIWLKKCKVCGIRQGKEILARELRQAREAKRSRLRQRINAVVPELFRNAHVREIPFVLRSKLQALVENERGAYIYGKPGTGKSYSLCAIARELIISGHKVRRIIWERLTLEIRGTYKRGDATTELDIIQPLIDCDVLIIEDLGCSTSENCLESDFNLRVLLTILDARYEACRPIWFTSNKSIVYLGESFDERIASRISGHCEPICLEGVDRRRNPKLKLINTQRPA